MLCETLKALKNQKNWSNQNLADAANLPVDTVNKILSGHTKTPNSDTLKRLAAALDTTVDTLIAVETHMPPPAFMQERSFDEIAAIYQQQIKKMEEQYERRLEEYRAREDKLTKRNERQFLIMLAILIVIVFIFVYLLLDALHGHWGLFRY